MLRHRIHRPRNAQHTVGLRIRHFNDQLQLRAKPEIRTSHCQAGTRGGHQLSRLPRERGIGGGQIHLNPLGSVPVGTQAEVIGQSGGWIQLKLDDGRTGYVFQNNLRDVPEPPAPETPTSTTTPAADVNAAGSPATTIPGAMPISDDLPTLKNEITTLRAKVESLGEALDRQRLADAGNGTGLVEHVPRDGAVSMTVAALLVGLFFGGLLTTLFQRRSDRRQWNKLRF